MKYVIMAKANSGYFMLAVKANDNRKIKGYKAQGYQIVGRLHNDTLACGKSLTIYAEG